MKQLTLILIALFLVPAALLPAVARSQILPDAPSPALPSDPMWDRVKDLSNGAAIVVRNDNGPPVHCLFAGATDAYLFCNPSTNPPGVGFRFDRAAIVSVDLDRPAPYSARFDRPKPNYHPVYLSSIIAGGLFVGICATGSADNKTAAEEGLIGALVVAAIGAPIVFLSQLQDRGSPYQPSGFARVHSPFSGFHPRPLPSLFGAHVKETP
jgi:hypothetical protein